MESLLTFPYGTNTTVKCTVLVSFLSLPVLCSFTAHLWFCYLSGFISVLQIQISVMSREESPYLELFQVLTEHWTDVTIVVAGLPALLQTCCGCGPGALDTSFCPPQRSETVFLGQVCKPLSFSYSLLNTENATLEMRQTHPPHVFLHSGGSHSILFTFEVLFFFTNESQSLDPDTTWQTRVVNGPLSNKH